MSERVPTQGELIATTAAWMQREEDCKVVCESCRLLNPVNRSQIGSDFWWHGDMFCNATALRNRPTVTIADVEKRLAHHDAEVFHTTLDELKHDGSELVVGGKEPVRIFSEEALNRKLAEARLAEAKIWAERYVHFILWDEEAQRETHRQERCFNCQRIAQLEAETKGATPGSSPVDTEQAK